MAFPFAPELVIPIFAVPEIVTLTSAEIPFPSLPVLVIVKVPPEILMLVSDVKLAVEKLSATPKVLV